MGWECGTYQGETHTGFCLINLRKRDHFEDLGLDVRIILK
jgi:hypothetical protein